ncbi:MAG: YkgJ family cysteine cluster protein [Gammaproteobacteria bacterium]|nr:YkgJ family cysteine cluster protein [Gammaproteobacteria bacterium]
MQHRREVLRFECTGCGACCRGEEGYVFLTADDVARMSARLGISAGWFRRRYTDRLADGVRVLRSAPGGACVFLSDAGRCRVYRARPLQCRTYPFWPEVVASRASWRAEARRCEGIGRGAPVPIRRVERALAALRAAGLSPTTTTD